MCDYSEKEIVMEKGTVDIENLRERVMLSKDTVWGIMSFKKGVGKTYISEQLVGSLLKAGKKVLVISFEKDSIKGAEELATELEKQGCLEKIVYSDKIQKLVEQYKQEYDYIVMDMMSLEESSIAKRISSLCENNFIVVSKDIENGKEMGEKVQQLKSLNINLAGIVLNEYHEKKMLLRM